MHPRRLKIMGGHSTESFRVRELWTYPAFISAKPSAVGQLLGQLSRSSFRLEKWVVSCNQMADITRQWWRRLVNAYEVKAGMVCLQCNNCVIHTWALQRWASHNGALYKSLFLYLSFYDQTQAIGYLWQTGAPGEAWWIYFCNPTNGSRLKLCNYYKSIAIDVYACYSLVISF